MYRLREPSGIKRVAYDFDRGGFVALILGLFASALCYGGFAITVSEHNAEAKGNRALLALLDSSGDKAEDKSETAKQARKESAQTYVDIESDIKDVADEADKLGLYGDQWKQIKHVAKTGNPAELDTSTMSYGWPFGWPFLPLWLLGMWCVMGTASLMTYFNGDGLLSETRLADLKWRQRATWLTVVGYGPVIWLAMLISRVLLISTPYPAEGQHHNEARRHEQDQGFEEVAAENQRSAAKKRKRTTYASSPVAARSTYIKVRTEAGRQHQQRRLTDLDGDIEYSVNRARELGTELRETQVEINELRAERKAIAEAVDDSSTVSATVAGEEFDRIAQLPGVIATNVVNDRLRVTVRATHEYNGTVYDLGDWQIDIGADTESVHAKELRSGVRDDWYSDYPAYRLARGTFCFGDRLDIINQHIMKGQYLEALALAIECLNGVNEEDKRHIPGAFYTTA